MKKTLKFNLFVILLFVCLVGFVGCKNDTKASINNSNGFNQAEAIAEAVKSHPEFASNPNDTVTKELPIGGKQASTAEVKFTTKVESSDKSTYLVTFTKDWGITVNGTYVKSFWKYRVTQDNIKLIESVDNDNLPNIIK